jgi:hypothetical protein
MIVFINHGVSQRRITTMLYAAHILFEKLMLSFSLPQFIEFAPCRLLQEELLYHSSKRHGVKHKR